MELSPNLKGKYKINNSSKHIYLWLLLLIKVLFKAGKFVPFMINFFNAKKCYFNFRIRIKCFFFEKVLNNISFPWLSRWTRVFYPTRTGVHLSLSHQPIIPHQQSFYQTEIPQLKYGNNRHALNIWSNSISVKMPVL